MPFDSIEAEPVLEIAACTDDLASLRPMTVVLNEACGLGDALRAARTNLGLTIEDIAQATRVRREYLANLEAFDIGALPARPFAIGYLRAYARALGVEPDGVVARFQAEAPAADDLLRAPAGLRKAPRRLGLVGGAAILVATGLVAWNVARHAQAETRPRPGVALHTVSQQKVEGPARLGAPLPPPPEASAPPAYATPGLGASVDDIAPAIGERFVPAGAIYGARGAPPQNEILLQARKATSLIVRGPGGAVYFARELSPGEAWRAPASGEGLTVDVGSPAAVEVFASGISRGALSAARTQVSHLAG